MKRLTLLILTMGCAALPAMGQDKIDGFVARFYNAQSGETMPYRLFIPSGYKSHNYPLIIWLHGAGGAGTDNYRQIHGDQIPGTHIWITAANQAKHPAFVVVPQAAAGWDTTAAPNVTAKEVDRQKEIWDRVFKEPELVEWLFAQHK